MMNDELILALRKPVTVGAVTYSELHLTEPTVGQLIESQAEVLPIKQNAALLRLNAKVPQAAINQLSQRDFSDAIDFFRRFSDSPPAPTAQNDSAA